MKKWFSVICCLSVFFSCEKGFNPDNYGAFKDDRDGEVYKTVTIGIQTWMAENLRYLPEVSTPLEVSDSLKLYYVYDYYGSRTDRAVSTIDYLTFGVLYNFPAAMMACPPGWHLPDRIEWEILNNAVGIDNSEGLRSNEYWVSSNKGSNRVGLNALPAGCQENGRFREIGRKTGFWSSKIQSDSTATIWGFHSSLEIPEYIIVARKDGYPVRCLKD